MNFLDKISVLKGQKQELMQIKSTVNQSTDLSTQSLSRVTSAINTLKGANSYPTSFVLNSNRNNRENIRLIIMLDKSGSMKGTEYDIYDGIKELVEKHRNDNILISLITFDSEMNIEYEDIPISKVETNLIRPFGNTNLNGTIFTTANNFYKADNVCNLFVTITDGEDTENLISKEKVASLIKELRNSSNHFYFLGEAYTIRDINIVREMAKSLGFKDDNIEVFTRMGNGNKLNFQVISSMLDDLLNKGEISPDWNAPIRENLLMLTNGKRR